MSSHSSLHAAPPRPDTPTPLLGGLTPAQFMRRYWQKKPLLVRQAIPGITAPVSREALFALAGDDDVESRLVTHFRQRWSLTHGPFAPDELPSPRQRAWTLLLQGLNLHNDAASALLERFRFAPDMRLDDLMISYATHGGGVGPHFDSYDVFLIQVHGKRRWRIGAQRDLTLVDGLPVKMLAHFTPENEWVLEPGDMLYLPPHIAHDGIAEGECMTCSVGFRAPFIGELTNQFLYYLAERGLARGMRPEAIYRDAQPRAVTHPARIPPDFIEHVSALLSRVRWSQADVAGFLGAWLSEPKPTVVFDVPDHPASLKRFTAHAAQQGVRLDRKTLLLYDAQHYFVNGESGALAPVRKWLPALADTHRLSGKRFAALLLSSGEAMAQTLHEWYCAGWLQPGEFAFQQLDE